MLFFWRDKDTQINIIKTLQASNISTVWVVTSGKSSSRRVLSIPSTHLDKGKQYVLKHCRAYRDFMNESRVLKKISHDRILSPIRIYDSKRMILYECGTDDICNYCINRGVPPLSSVLKITAALVEALQYLHSRDIIHGDIKLENVVYFGGDVENVKLIDFGRSRTVSSIDTKKSYKYMLGTCGISPPEVREGYGYTNILKIDSWCLGVTLYNLSTGQELVLNEDTPVIEAARVNHPGLLDLIQKLIVIDPVDRLRILDIDLTKILC